VEINLNITASYTGLYRVGKASPVLASSAKNSSGYMGDSNFRKAGVVGNLFSVLPVLDIKDGSFGMHFSGEYYVNTVYLQGNQNNQVNPVDGSVSTSFLKETRNAQGHNGRMLDAFVYDSWAFGHGQQFTLKAGQQTLFWGQSLFSTNGISGGQAAVDVITAQNLVNPQSQQVFLPVGQIVATYQPNSTYTIQGYYQYQWIPYNLAGVGSYFSTSDVTGPGQQPLFLGTAAAYPTKAVTPEKQNGQFGLSLQAQYGNYDAGLFVERYDAKTPVLATDINLAGIPFPPYFIPAPGSTYHLIYPRDIWLYGTSLSTTIGATNVAGEVSLRTHNPLASPGPSGTPFNGFNTGNANSNPAYPVGNTMTMLANAIYGSPSLRFDPGGITLLGEVEYDKLLRVTANKAALQPGRSNDAMSIDMQVIPAFFEVLPNLELQFPVSLNYVVAGNSRVQSTMNHGTGSYSFGVSAIYRENWNASLSYVGYFGKASSNALIPETAGSPDRSYVSLNLNHTF
uniref:DUF1302 domain-containing protein n=1 Tax=Acidocella sp. TaxID=50710 RepID=UPI00262C5EA1